MHFTADTVAVVTGSSRGLGYQFVKQILGTTEASVVATARNVDKAAPLDALKKLYPKRIDIVQLDTSDEQSIQAS